MADKTINDLTAATTLAGGDVFEFENTGNNSRKITVANLQAALGIGMFLIAEQSPSGTGIVTFSGFPATYRDLILIVRGRGATAAASVAALMTFNNDTGTNYDKERLTASAGTTVSAAGNAAASNIDMGGIAAASATADVADVIQAEIFDYRGTTFQKAVLTRNTTKVGTASTNLTQQVQSGWWRSTAAITEIDVTLNAGNFVDGSVVSLYGRM